MAIQPIKTPSTTAYKAAIIALVLVIIVLVIFLPGSGGAAANQQQAEKSVKDLYSLITGSDAEVLKTTEQSGVYRIVVRLRDATGRDTVQDVFVTKDGLFFTDRLLSLEGQKSLLQNQSAFAACLFDRQVRVLGLANDPATLAQLQVLGAFSGRIYIDCGGQNAALCQQMNVTQVPVVFVNGTLVQGPQNLAWFEQNTGCTLSVGAATPAVNTTQ